MFFFTVALVASVAAVVAPLTAGAAPGEDTEKPSPGGSWIDAGWASHDAVLDGPAGATGVIELDWEADETAVTGDRFELRLPFSLSPVDPDTEVELPDAEDYLGATGTWSHIATGQSLLTVELEQDGVVENAAGELELLGGTVALEVTWSASALESLSDGEQTLVLRGPGFDGKNKLELVGAYQAPEPSPTAKPGVTEETTAKPGVTEEATADGEAVAEESETATPRTEASSSPSVTSTPPVGAAAPDRERKAAEVSPELSEAEGVKGALEGFSALIGIQQVGSTVPTPGVNMPLVGNYQSRFDAYTTQPSPNPAYPGSCGLDATIVIDTSGSMSSSDIANARNAASSVVSALGGTDSTARIVTFATRSPAGTNSPNTARLSVNSGANTLQNHISGIRGTGLFAGDGTNYEEAFLAVQQDAGDAVFFITDGGNAHSTSGPNYGLLGRPPNSPSAAVDLPYVREANVVKNGGARIVPFGIGSSFQTTGTSAPWMPVFWPMVRGDDGLSVLGRDYFHTANSAQLEQILVEEATRGCVGSLNITSKERLRNGREVNTGGFSYTASGPGMSFDPAGAVTTNNAGQAEIHIAGGDGQVTITQSPRDPYYIRSVACENNLTGATIPVNFTQGSDSFSLPLSSLSFASCSVVNDSPVIAGSLIWTKIDSQTGEYLAGSEWDLFEFSGSVRTQIQDCIADDESECLGPDQDPRSGHFFVTDLDYGMYGLMETVAPEEYQLSQDPRILDIEEGEVVDLGGIENVSIYGGLAWSKIDVADINVADPEYLAGSVWELTPMSGSNAQTDVPIGPTMTIRDCVIDDFDENGSEEEIQAALDACAAMGHDLDPRPGRLMVDDLLQGYYRAHEVVAPLGYAPWNEPLPIHLYIAGGAIDDFGLRVPNTPEELELLSFSKVDADFSQERLADSEWELYRLGTTGQRLSEPMSITDCIADDPAECAEGPDLNPEPGEFTLELGSGIYSLEETLAPVGYEMFDEVLYFYFFEGELTPLELVDGEFAPIEGEDPVNSGEVEIPNLSNGLSAMRWTKVAADTPELLLGGSEWELFELDANGDRTGESVVISDCVADNPAECVGEMDRDRQAGQFLVELPAGEYEMVEATAPAGYEPAYTVMSLSVTDDEVLDLGAIENDVEIPRGDLIFSKVDEQDPELRLAGSIWELQPLDGAGEPDGPALEIEDCVAGSEAECVGLDRDPRAGEFAVTGLPQGEYEFTEIQAPVGYVLPDVSGGVIEIGDEPVGGPIPNERMVEPSVLSWTKVSAADTDQLLGGSEWELTRLDGDGEPMGAPLVITDCVADTAQECSGQDQDPRAGGFEVGGLDPGTYSLVETAAPAGYLLDDTPQVGEVDGPTSFGEIENIQRQGLTIPLTGGMGADRFLLIGGLLAALAAAGVVWRHRRQQGLDGSIMA